MVSHLCKQHRWLNYILSHLQVPRDGKTFLPLPREAAEQLSLNLL